MWQDHNGPIYNKAIHMNNANYEQKYPNNIIIIVQIYEVFYIIYVVTDISFR